VADKRAERVVDILVAAVQSEDLHRDLRVIEAAAKALGGTAHHRPALIGAVQACRRGPGAFALGAPAGLPRELMCGRVDTGAEVAVGRGLVAIGERLITLRARLVGV